MVVVGHVVGAQRRVVGLHHAVAHGSIDAEGQGKVQRGVAGEAHQRRVAHVEHLVPACGLRVSYLVHPAVGIEQRGCYVGGQRCPRHRRDASLQSDHEVLLRCHDVVPAFVDGVQPVVGAQEVEVDVVARRAVAYLEAPSHAGVLWPAGGRVVGIVVDGFSQLAVEGSHAQFLAIILQANAVPRHVQHVGREVHGRLSDVARPLLVGRREVERQLRIAEAGIVVAVVQREGHGDAKEADVKVGVDHVAHGRRIAVAHRRVVVGVGRSYGSAYHQRVAFGNGGNVLSLDVAERHQTNCNDQSDRRHPSVMERFYHGSAVYHFAIFIVVACGPQEALTV